MALRFGNSLAGAMTRVWPKQVQGHILNSINLNPFMGILNAIILKTSMSIKLPFLFSSLIF